jgi:putative peptide zinc metalloprotease protein
VKQRFLVTVAAFIAALGLAGFQPASAFAADDTAAVAVNTKDGSSMFKLAFAIKRAAGDVVDNVNAAVAISSCNECRTVAISIQIVLVTGNPSVVTPQNIALALNVECTSCETFASAYQFVLSTDEDVGFTREGKREVRDIRKELRDLRRAGLTLAELDARLNVLMQRLAQVLRNELVAKGDRRGRGDDDGDDDERAPPTTTGETSPTTSTTPTTTTGTTTETTPTTGTETTPTTTTP